MRIFLDVNILFSASKSAGAVRRLVALLVHEKHELSADAFVLEEARRNLWLKFPAALPSLPGCCDGVGFCIEDGLLAGLK